MFVIKYQWKIYFDLHNNFCSKIVNFKKKIEDSIFMSGRCAAVIARGITIGFVRILYPHVIYSIELSERS